MKLIEALKLETKKVELYAARKPKYNCEEQTYFYDNDALVSLSLFDTQNKFANFYPMIKNYLLNNLANMQTKDYSNDDNFEGFLSLDTSLNLDYQERLIVQLCAVDLLDKPSLTFQYLLIRVVDEQHDDILIWLKLKSPIKVEENTFSSSKHEYQLKLKNDDISIDNYPNINFSLDMISFIMYQDDFYILNKDLYQKYFNLESYYLKQAQNLIFANQRLISDAQIITRANSKFIYEFYEDLDSFLAELEQNTTLHQQVSQTLDEMTLQLGYDPTKKQFLLKKPQDLVDLILLSSGCLGIDKYTNQEYRVKKPNYLEK